MKADACVIGISGPTSSGKTSLAHILAHILSCNGERQVINIHQDDFFFPKEVLVPNTRGEMDADCHDAVDFQRLKETIRFVKCVGNLPASFKSGQDDKYEKEKGLAMVDLSLIDPTPLYKAVKEAFHKDQPVIIVDGFLLYHCSEIRRLFDVKLFLVTKRELAKERRFARPIYNGPDVGGAFFWRTREYFDRIVWRNYEEEHRQLFKENDVESANPSDHCIRLGIYIQQKVKEPMQETVEWALNKVIEKLKREERHRELVVS